MPTAFCRVLLLVLALTACSSARDDWHRAETEDTPESYQAFLTRHPDGAFAERARARLASLIAEQEWRQARTADTIPAYERFLRKHADSDNAEAARGRITELRRTGAYEAALVADNAAALQAFLSQYPQGREAELARQRLALLEPASSPAEQPRAPLHDAAEAATGGTGTSDTGHFRVQLGAFRSAASAAAERDRLAAAYSEALPSVQVRSDRADGLHRVQSETMSREEAAALCSRLRERGEACFVVSP